MTLRVDVEDGAARWSEIMAEVEAGREVVIARGAVPVAVMKGEPERPSREEVARAVAELRSNRKNFQPITYDEIVAWKNEGKR